MEVNFNADFDINNDEIEKVSARVNELKQTLSVTNDADEVDEIRTELLYLLEIKRMLYAANIIYNPEEFILIGDMRVKKVDYDKFFRYLEWVNIPEFDIAKPLNEGDYLPGTKNKIKVPRDMKVGEDIPTYEEYLHDFYKKSGYEFPKRELIPGTKVYKVRKPYMHECYSLQLTENGYNVVRQKAIRNPYYRKMKKYYEEEAKKIKEQKPALDEIDEIKIYEGAYVSDMKKVPIKVTNIEQIPVVSGVKSIMDTIKENGTPIVKASEVDDYVLTPAEEAKLQAYEKTLPEEAYVGISTTGLKIQLQDNPGYDSLTHKNGPSIDSRKAVKMMEGFNPNFEHIEAKNKQMREGAIEYLNKIIGPKEKQVDTSPTALLEDKMNEIPVPEVPALTDNLINEDESKQLPVVAPLLLTDDVIEKREEKQLPVSSPLMIADETTVTQKINENVTKVVEVESSLDLANQARMVIMGRLEEAFNIAEKEQNSISLSELEKNHTISYVDIIADKFKVYDESIVEVANIEPDTKIGEGVAREVLTGLGVNAALMNGEMEVTPETIQSTVTGNKKVARKHPVYASRFDLLSDTIVKQGKKLQKKVTGLINSYVPFDKDKEGGKKL